MADNRCGNNRCGMGYCSLAYSSVQVAECRAVLPLAWNGQCAYQDGARVEDGAESVMVRVRCDTCTRGGCEMGVGAYARWNGLCAYKAGRASN